MFATADFGFTDPSDTPANALAAVKVTTLPAVGSLKLDGVAVAANDFVAAADIAAGKLKFFPAANGNGAGYASFNFRSRTTVAPPMAATTRRHGQHDHSRCRLGQRCAAGADKTVTTQEDTAYSSRRLTSASRIQRHARERVGGGQDDDAAGGGLAEARRGRGRCQRFRRGSRYRGR